MMSMGVIDPGVTRNAAGRYFNQRLLAPNVWEVDVDPRLVDEAAALFAAIDAPLGICIQTKPESGAFFSQRPGWDSDISWVSVDDESTYESFRTLFDGMLRSRFDGMVDGPLRLYSAFFVRALGQKPSRMVAGLLRHCLSAGSPLVKAESERDSAPLGFRGRARAPTHEPVPPATPTCRALPCRAARRGAGGSLELRLH